MMLSDFCLLVALIQIIVTYLGLVALGKNERCTFLAEVGLWWKFARYIVFISFWLIVIGVISFFGGLTYLEEIKYGYDAPTGTTCSSVTVSVGNTGGLFQPSQGNRWRKNVGTVWLPVIIGLTVTFLSFPVHATHQLARGLEPVYCCCKRSKKVSPSMEDQGESGDDKILKTGDNIEQI